MSLFCTENFQDLSYTFLKLSFELRNAPGIFPEQPGCLYRVAEGIHLKFFLPHPGILIRIILFPAGAAGGRIKGIGVRLDTNILKLPNKNLTVTGVKVCGMLFLTIWRPLPICF